MLSVTQVHVGDEVPCECAKLLDDKVLIRHDGIWTELRAPAVDRAREIAEAALNGSYAEAPEALRKIISTLAR